MLGLSEEGEKQRGTESSESAAQRMDCAHRLQKKWLRQRTDVMSETGRPHFTYTNVHAGKTTERA